MLEVRYEMLDFFCYKPKFRTSADLRAGWIVGEVKSIHKLLLSVVFLTMMLTSSGQGTKTDFRPYYLKKNQHTITYSPVAFIGYKYAYCINPYFGLGLGLSLGARMSEIPHHSFEMAKVNVFYRVHFGNIVYLNIGVFAALEGEAQPFRGFEGEVFCGWNHFKLGQGIQLGTFNDQMSDNGGEEFMVVVNLLILQLNL
jgi:hypothetical protein